MHGTTGACEGNIPQCVRAELQNSRAEPGALLGRLLSTAAEALPDELCRQPKAILASSPAAEAANGKGVSKTAFHQSRAEWPWLVAHHTFILDETLKLSAV